MLTALTAFLAIGVAAGYFAIALLILPRRGSTFRFSLPGRSPTVLPGAVPAGAVRAG